MRIAKGHVRFTPESGHLQRTDSHGAILIIPFSAFGNATRAALSAFVPAGRVGAEGDASEYARAIRPKVC